jgi:prepilin-type N-terminal cleavage/methylation domain-containing protein
MKTSAFKFTGERQNKYRRRAASRRARQSGFTLAEVIVSVAITAMVFISLYTGISTCFSTVQSNRENVRATQILQEKLEVARLYNWNQVTGGFIPQDFTEAYSANAGPSGLVYTGKVTLGPAPVTETYGSDLRQIRVELTWTSGKVTHKREMTTFIAKYGLQNYFFNL